MSRSYRHGDRQKEKRFGDNWHWYKQEPKAWRREQKHKKRRSAARAAVHEVMEGNEDAAFPLDKKPWRYFW